MKQMTPKSSECLVFASPLKEKQFKPNSKPVQNEVQVQVTFSWKISSKAWTDHKEHLENCKKDVKIKFEYDPISTFYALNDIAFPDVLNFNVT